MQIWFELIASIDYHPSRNYKLCHYTKIYLISIWCGRFPGYDIFPESEKSVQFIFDTIFCKTVCMFGRVVAHPIPDNGKAASK